jgi:hypothetical protein
MFNQKRYEQLKEHILENYSYDEFECSDDYCEFRYLNEQRYEFLKGFKKVVLTRMLAKALWACKKFYETKDYQYKEIRNHYESAYFYNNPPDEVF